MDCFVESDICNMDEFPSSLQGNRSKHFISDINTKHEIEGCLENKSFATIILCVFLEGNNRVGSVLSFRGTWKVAASEEKTLCT